MVKTRRAAQSAEGKYDHLFKKAPKDFRIGRGIQPKKNLSRFVKWPRYVRLQRQKSILLKRLRVPPALNQFTQTIDKNQAQTLFKLMGKYRPESAKEKRQRLQAAAEAKDDGAQAPASSKPKVVKYGINQITSLVESRKAKLVVIANDVDPIELVLWLPTLCRKMQVPFCIVKSKARLGALVYQKTCTAVALTSVNKGDERALQQFVGSVEAMYEDPVTSWGAPSYGIKSRAKIRARERELNREQSKRR